MNLDRYEMAHIITCVGCGKTWLLVSSAHLHLFIYGIGIGIGIGGILVELIC